MKKMIALRPTVLGSVDGDSKIAEVFLTKNSDFHFPKN